MSYTCPACGYQATLTACEHCGGTGNTTSSRAEIAALKGLLERALPYARLPEALAAEIRRAIHGGKGEV